MPDNYIRGGGGVSVDPRKAGTVVGLLCAVTLLVLAVVFTAAAASQDSRLSSLQRHGIPVQVTVTSCLGVASGTGATVYYYVCRGSYRLDGRTYNEVVKGTTADHPVGSILSALTLRDHPGLLTEADAVTKRHSSFTPYVTPIVLGAIAVVLLAGLGWWRSRPGRPAERPPAPGSGAGSALFAQASRLDADSREAEAIDLYRQALSAGLPSDLEVRALIQLGSSLRVVGQVSEAIEVHREAQSRYPDNGANPYFLALALHRIGADDRAVAELFNAGLAQMQSPDLAEYSRALTAYRAELAPP